jgi:hypothetical protein
MRYLKILFLMIAWLIILASVSLVLNMATGKLARMDFDYSTGERRLSYNVLGVSVATNPDHGHSKQIDWLERELPDNAQRKWVRAKYLNGPRDHPPTLMLLSILGDISMLLNSFTFDDPDTSRLLTLQKILRPVLWELITAYLENKQASDNLICIRIHLESLYNQNENLDEPTLRLIIQDCDHPLMNPVSD